MRQKKKKIGRKLLSFLLTLAMVVGLMPGMGLTAYAATAYTSGEIRITDIANGDIIKSNCGIYKNSGRSLEIYDTDGVTLLQSYGSDGWNRLAALGYDTIVTKTGTGGTDRLVKLQKLDPVPQVTNVSLDQSSLSLTVGGETATLTATVTANYDAVKTIGWSSSDTSVATVNNGVVTPVAAGTATITATSSWDHTMTAICAVTVSKGDPIVPTDLTATYGQTLADVELPDGWTWADSTQSVGNVVSPAANFKANFAENDNYNAASNVDVAVTVNKADPAAPTGLTAAYGQTLADVMLPDGWTWADDKQSVGDIVSTAATFKANFAENENYNAASNVDLTVTVNKADTVVTAPTAKTLTYTGSAQELVAAGTATGGEMLYALGNATKATGAYSASIPTATDAGTYYVWYKVVGDENHTDTEPMSLKVTIADKGDTEIKTEVKKDDKSPEIKTSNLTDEFAESTLSNEEKAAIEEAINNGEDVKVDVYLEIEDISDTISASDKEKIEASATNADNIAFFDISLFKEISISGQSQGAASIHNLTTPLKLTIGVPKSFPAVADGYSRTYKILRLHDGSVTVLPTTLNADGTLSFETDEFSTYALAYTDSNKEEVTTETPTTEAPTTKVDTPTTEAPKANTPKAPTTGDKINIGVIVMLMIDSALAGLYLTLRRRLMK